MLRIEVNYYCENCGSLQKALFWIDGSEKSGLQPAKCECQAINLLDWQLMVDVVVQKVVETNNSGLVARIDSGDEEDTPDLSLPEYLQHKRTESGETDA